MTTAWTSQLTRLASQCAAAACLAAAACAADADDFQPVTMDMLMNPAPGDWLMIGRTYDEQRFSPLGQVNRDNVDELRLAWARGLPPGAESTIPLVHAGVHERD